MQHVTDNRSEDNVDKSTFAQSVSDIVDDEINYVKNRRKTIHERLTSKAIATKKEDKKEKETEEVLRTNITHKKQSVLREKILRFNKRNREKKSNNEENSFFNSTENEESIKKNLWGIAFSGGGIRSATFCLGAVQALTKAGVFKYFDYMSTVSGGGYMGSCITSLLQDQDKQIGVDADDSPFVGLNDGTDIYDINETKMSVRNNIHHLRAHGNYLATENGVLKRDMLRFIGTFIFGSVYHILLFTILGFALVSTLLFYIQPFISAERRVINSTGDSSITSQHTTISFHQENMERLGFTETNTLPFSIEPAVIEKHIKGWYNKAFLPSAQRIIPDFIDDPTNYERWLKGHPNIVPNNEFPEERKSKALAFGVSFVLGILCVIVSLIIARIRKQTAVSYITEQQQFQKKKDDTQFQELEDKIKNAKSGRTIQDDVEYLFAKRYTFFSTAITIITAWIIAYIYRPMPELLFLPVSFALGAFSTTLLVTLIHESYTPQYSRVTRSFNSILKGASFFGLLASIILPFLLVFIFSLSYFSFTFYVSVIAAFISGYLFKKNNSGKTIPAFLVKYYEPVANILVLFLLLFIIPPITRILLNWTETLASSGITLHDFMPLAFIIASALSLIIITIFINSNKISAHAFYRDRLTETYLMTNTRVNRNKKNSSSKKQGHPLLTIRNNETLKFNSIEKNNPKSPYHLIVTALNLRDNDETLRKSLKSEHFIFSPHWIGSEYTGYVRTKEYNKGEMQLSTAMTISGAAFNSFVGFRTFFAQSLFATLLNVRLGYWLPNPWYYGSKKKPDRSFTVWIWYLLKEMMGKTSADARLVYLSDGGHTGDNLGLLPLLQRRNRVIFVLDAEADKNYTFDSFNTALHLAFVEENICVEIDLSNIVRQNQEYPELLLQQQSFAIGTVYYPKTEKHEASEGIIVYLKASCSIYDCEKEGCEDALNTDNPNIQSIRESIEQMPINISPDEMPVFIENYNRKHADFPHQSTADQFFDPEQFGAYRALGEHVAWQALYALAHSKL